MTSQAPSLTDPVPVERTEVLMAVGALLASIEHFPSANRDLLLRCCFDLAEQAGADIRRMEGTFGVMRPT